MRRILCLHMPHLATQRARRDATPQVDSHRPLVLTSRNGTMVVVEQVCPDAFELGLYPGMTLGQARARVPQLASLEHQPRSDTALLRRLARWALRFSPTVEPVEPDTLLLDISGCQRLFGGEANIVQQAAEGLRRTGLVVHAALADTIGAAYAVATTGADETAIVPPGQGSAHLAPLPPGALRIAPEVAAQLESLGVRTIGDLLMLPWSTLPARFGQSLVRRLQQALGEVDECVVPYRPSPVPAAREVFEVAVSDWSLLCSNAERLLAELLERLRQRDRTLRRLVCTVSYEAISPAVVSVGLSRATCDASHLWPLLRQRLERVDIAPGVNGLVLMARESERHRDDQLTLFDNRAPGDDEALGRLIDSLTSRLGHEAVVRPRPVDDHQPEMAFRTIPVAETGCAPEEEACQSTSEASAPDQCFYPPSTSPGAMNDGLGTDARPPDRPPPAGHPGTVPRIAVGLRNQLRPVRLFPRPVPIRVIAMVPDGPPTWMLYRGREHTIAAAEGPERIETAWWRGSEVRRDYFRVATADGAQFWVFRAHDQQQWYLHGVFA